MNQEIESKRQCLGQIERQIADLNSQRDALLSQIGETERRCSHHWSEPVRQVKHHAGYYVPGDRERGVELGVDSRPGCHVPPRDDVWYERTCSKCGRTEKTTRTKPAGEVPVF